MKRIQVYALFCFKFCFYFKSFLAERCCKDIMITVKFSLNSIIFIALLQFWFCFVNFLRVGYTREGNGFSLASSTYHYAVKQRPTITQNYNTDLWPLWPQCLKSFLTMHSLISDYLFCYMFSLFWGFFFLFPKGLG